MEQKLCIGPLHAGPLFSANIPPIVTKFYMHTPRTYLPCSMLADFSISLRDEWYSPKCRKKQMKKVDISIYFKSWLSAMAVQEKKLYMIKKRHFLGSESSLFHKKILKIAHAASNLMRMDEIWVQKNLYAP